MGCHFLRESQQEFPSSNLPGISWSLHREVPIQGYTCYLFLCYCFVCFYVGIWGSCFSFGFCFGVCVVCCFDASFSSVQFGRSVMSDSLRPHGLQHARLPCPSPTPTDASFIRKKKNPTVCKTAIHSLHPILLILFLAFLGSVAAGSVCAAVMPNLTTRLLSWGCGEGPEGHPPDAPGISPSRE